MTKPYTEQVFRTTYKDDYRDSDNYYRILFNSGRALQARELTQLQTIIQSEISRFASNLFVDGAPIQPGGVKIDNFYDFIKLDPAYPLPSDLTSVQNIVFTGQTTGIKVKIFEAIAAENSDPPTVYVTYMDQPADTAQTTVPTLQPEEIFTGVVNSSTVTLKVQRINTTQNPAVGYGSRFTSASGSFFVQGHFVFAPQQSIILSKYTNNPNATVGFKVVQDIVTASDNEALFDNQGVVPNRASPGADRYRIRLQLINKADLAEADNFVYISDIQFGVIKTKPTTTDGFNSIRKEMALRTKEESGDYITKYFKAKFHPNNATELKLKVQPGTAYIEGYRVSKEIDTTLIVPKANSTFQQENENIGIDYGNYYEWDSGVGMMDFDDAATVNLMSGLNGTGSLIATAKVRAIREGVGSNYNIHLFDIQRDVNASVGSNLVKSIVQSDTSAYVNLVLNSSGNAVLKEPRKKSLLFPTPVPRPQTFESISLTKAQKFEETASGNAVTITTSSATDTFTNTGDWIVANSSDALLTFSVSLTNNQRSATITGLPNGAVEILAYIRRANGKVRQKTLTETTVTSTLDSDGQGKKYISLLNSDIYDVLRVTTNDSDGNNVASAFALDPGQRETHYDDGRMIYTGGLDSDGVSVFVRYRYFEHGDGDFFAVNSYDGQLEYQDIPSFRDNAGNNLSLRNVLDFRPATNGSGTFTVVNDLPQPTGLVETDATYYLPRFDKLVLSKGGELRYLTGVPSLQPKFPSTPQNCIDLYKFQLGANTLHTRDITSEMMTLKGYKMSDINKLEKKINKLEELVTLSMLELSTQNTKVLDGSGNDRTKSGFFVDNFTTHTYSDTKSPEYRASIDTRGKLLRPSFKQEAIDLTWDSAHPEQRSVVRFGDLIMLDHSEVIHTAQDLASRVENVNPFYIEKVVGAVKLSPSSDYWKETKQAPERVIDNGFVIDASKAFLYNEEQYSWIGQDVNEQPIGTVVGTGSVTTTTTTQNTSEPVLTGSATSQNVGSWVQTGTSQSIDQQTIGSETDVSTDRTAVPSNEPPKPIYENLYSAGQTYWHQEPTHSPGDDVWDVEVYVNGSLVASRYAGALPYELGGYRRGGNKALNTYGLTRITGYEQPADDYVDVITTTERDIIETSTHTTVNYGREVETVQTDTYLQLTTTNVNTTTTETVDRIAADYTVRESLGTRVIDVYIIPWMRRRRVAFRAEGLRPNTRYFPFFDGVPVSKFCHQGDFQRMSDRGVTPFNPAAGNLYEHTEGSTNLISNADGIIEGSFEIPNVQLRDRWLRFQVGSREFALYDISSYNKDNALSFAEAYYDASGILETTQETFKSTRHIEIVGSQTTTETFDTVTEGSSFSTNTVVDLTTEERSETETTVTESYGDTRTDAEVQEPQTVIANEVPVVSEPGSATVPPTDPRIGIPAASNPPSISLPKKGPATTLDPVTGAGSVGAGDIYLGRGRGGMSALRDGEGVNIYIDPLAQSFEVPDPNGIFVTRVRVYFATKPDVANGSANLPVHFELRPMVNGVPHSNHIIPGSKIVKPASKVNLVPGAVVAPNNSGTVTGVSSTDMLSNGTDFIFEEPVYLQGGTEYAIVLRSDSQEYKVFTSEVEDFVLGSTERRISKQPYLGSLFKSQNSKTWEPNGREDLAFRIYRANFVSKGASILENVDVSRDYLPFNPFYVERYNRRIRVNHYGHGLSVGDTTIIGGLDSDTRYAGILGSSIIGSRTVLEADGSFYSFNADSDATSTANFGRGGCFGSQNIIFDKGILTAEVLQPQTTNHTFFGKFTSAQSLAGNEARYDQDTTYTSIPNKQAFSFNRPRGIYNPEDEATNLVNQGEGRSLTVKCTMTTTDPRVSPVIDLERCGFVAVGNMIDRQDSAASSGFNVPLDFFPETDKNLGTHLAKHLTSPSTLAEEAVGLKIILAAHKPPEADFDVYYRVASADQKIRSQEWVLIDEEEARQADTNPNIFREYRYLVGGVDGDQLDPFNQFQIKIVFKSTNSAKVPLIRDLRAIALAV